MRTEVDIARIAEEHAQLEQNVANYDRAPAELHDTIDFLSNLERDLAWRESQMKKLIEKRRVVTIRKAEHKDIDKLQRSSTRRFFTRIKHGGKEGLERRLEKEEREYIEAAQNEHNENIAISELKAAVENASLKKVDLESQVVIRKEILQRIDELYKSAFDGPSPEFPEEDAAEEELRGAKEHFEHVQAQLSHEKNVFAILNQAATCANQAQSALQNANLAATYDTWQIGGAWAQMAEADDLIRAQSLSAQAQRLLDRARGLQPLVKQVQPGRIASPEWLHVVFDNIYTDLMFQQKIKRSIESVRTFQEGIFTECAACEGRIKDLQRDANEAQEFLKSRRRQLVATRREILTRVREEGGLRVVTRAGEDITSTRFPQLPTYAQEPEEGSRVLARAEPRNIPSMPIPIHQDQPSPPSYDGQPSFPIAGMIQETSRLAPPGVPPPSHAGSASSDRSYGSPPALSPRLSQSSYTSYAASPLDPGPGTSEVEPGPSSTPCFAETIGSRTDGSAISTELTNTYDEVPMQSGQAGGGRNETHFTRFASNNPFRISPNSSG